MSQEVKNYELAYLLSPSLEEADALAHTAKIAGLIQDAGGVTRKSEAPRKRSLAYPIRKSRQAYFGWITFNAESGAIGTIEKKIKDLKEMLRHFIVEEEVETRPISLRTVPYSGAAMRAPHAPPREAEKIDEKLDLEALDKKLEEILGK